MTEVVMILTTVSTSEQFTEIAKALVSEKLAACVQMSSPIVSMYSWEGALETEEEIAITIKTSSEISERVVARLVELHPFVVPQITIVPVIGGYSPYLEWVQENTKA